jgi:sucrose-6F-phosphate phosphohydrolase
VAGTSYLLISDLDGTLLGDDLALGELADWYVENQHRLKLAYSSGRFTHSIRESIEQTDLPPPAVVVGGVGSQMEWFETGEPVGQWPVTAGNWDAFAIQALLTEVAGLEPQPQEFQSEHKLSYFYQDATPEQLQMVRELLAEQFAVELVYSSRRDLDVLPAGVDKGSAARFLAEFLDLPASQVIVSGDSANDLRMFEQGFRGIVVGNGHPELKSLSTPDVFFATRNEAGGVLEGLKRWMD